MSRHRLTVVLAQAQGRNPASRALEESIVAALILESGLDVSVVPHLSDLDAEHTGRLFLGSVQGDMAVLSWLAPLVCSRLLDQNGIKGQFVAAQLAPPMEDDEAGEPQPGNFTEVPDRSIYCLDLRRSNSHELYVAEVRRIAQECRQRRLVQSNGAPHQPAIVQLGMASIAEEPVGARSDLVAAPPPVSDDTTTGNPEPAVDVPGGLPKRRTQAPQDPKDDLDNLIDSLDSLGP
jgi:hypothetical protein